MSEQQPMNPHPHDHPALIASSTDASLPPPPPVVVVDDNDDKNNKNEANKKSDEEDLPLILQDLKHYLLQNHHDDDDDDKDSSSSISHHHPTTATTATGTKFRTRTRRTGLFDKSVPAVPVAAIKALLGVVQRSKSETMMGLQDELDRNARIMLQHNNDNYDTAAAGSSNSSYSNHIALQSGIELFLKYVTRTFLERPNFEDCRQTILQRGERFTKLSYNARAHISHIAADFVPKKNNSRILTLGWSRVVAAILQYANQVQNKQFELVILQGPEQSEYPGLQAAQCYATEMNNFGNTSGSNTNTTIPIIVTVVPDAAMGYLLSDNRQKIDMVLVGADGVVENGGIINQLGTNAVAACAYLNGIPFYVAAESYKFARLYPLHQSDLQQQQQQQKQPSNNNNNKKTNIPSSGVAPGSDDDDQDGGRDDEGGEVTSSLLSLDPSIQVVQPSVDFTPAKYITLLFTDLGVLTPSAVSDELIRLYQ